MLLLVVFTGLLGGGEKWPQGNELARDEVQIQGEWELVSISSTKGDPQKGLAAAVMELQRFVSSGLGKGGLVREVETIDQNSPGWEDQTSLFEGDALSRKGFPGTPLRFKLYPTMRPKAFDLFCLPLSNEPISKGIYSLDGDELRICFPVPDLRSSMYIGDYPRPTTFDLGKLPFKYSYAV